jgi:hypothetical protein
MEVIACHPTLQLQSKETLQRTTQFSHEHLQIMNGLQKESHQKEMMNGGVYQTQMKGNNLIE